jgi:two-component system OmpR family response regulator
MRILLIEDDHLIGNAIQHALKDVAYSVDWVKDGQAGLSSAQTEDYDLILLDLGLPKKHGLDVLSNLRDSQNTMPVIIITAQDAVEDRIKGLDLGADDYLVKPFSIDELVARARAVIRRNQGAATSILANSEFSLDETTSILTQDEHAFELSAREFALMRLLLLKPGRILSKSELEEHIYGWNEEVASNAIEFIIHGLRKKLGKTAIKNVRGLGWMVNK